MPTFRRHLPVREKIAQGPDPTKRFLGRVCEQHPDSHGLRHISSGTCVVCQKRNNLASRTPEAERLRYKVRLQALRAETLSAYGGVCVRCGENDLDVLTLDHTNQEGAAEYYATGRRSEKLWRWLRFNGWPNGYRVLCYNCNVKVFRLHQRGEKE